MELNDYAIRLFNAIEAVQDLKLFGDSAKLSKTEFLLLREIISERSRGNEIIASELSKRIGVTRSAISQLITKLEKNDILVRIPAPNDKKIAYIRLSDRAHAVFEEQCKSVNDLLDTCAEKFGADRMRRLSVDTDDFIALMKQMREAQ